jgi:hypothetical protein
VGQLPRGDIAALAAGATDRAALRFAFCFMMRGYKDELLVILQVVSCPIMAPCRN